jgi:hypothetical protein
VHEYWLTRQRLLRFLAERLGFQVFALEARRLDEPANPARPTASPLRSTLDRLSSMRLPYPAMASMSESTICCGATPIVTCEITPSERT